MANLPLVALSLLVRRVSSHRSLPAWWVAFVVFAGALLDWSLLVKGLPRPWAIRSQVPQWWGHRFGPWWGAARYGLRLGLGPATMLNSWLWWAALIATGTSPPSLLLGLTVFVLLRTLTTFAVSWGVNSGAGMAKRAQVLNSCASQVRYGVLLLIVAFSVLSLVWVG
jgi:hypothetical protein